VAGAVILRPDPGARNRVGVGAPPGVAGVRAVLACPPGRPAPVAGGPGRLRFRDRLLPRWFGRPSRRLCPWSQDGPAEAQPPGGRRL